MKYIKERLECLEAPFVVAAPTSKTQTLHLDHEFLVRPRRFPTEQMSCSIFNPCAIVSFDEVKLLITASVRTYEDVWYDLLNCNINMFINGRINTIRLFIC